MNWGTKLLANVAKSSAEFARRTGIAEYDPVRRVGVGVMEAVVPDEMRTIRVGDDIYMRVNPAVDGRWYYFADRDLRWGSGRDEWLADELSPGDTFVDVGAHVGYFSLAARNVVGERGRVIAFEPHPDTHSRLKENVERNDYENVVTEQLAVGEEPGQLTLYDGDKTIRATTVEAATPGDRAFEVDVVTLDDYLADARALPDLVAINAEGAEASVLAGMKRTLSETSPTVAVEVHPFHLEAQGSSATALLERLRELGYALDLTDGPGEDVDAAATRARKPFGVVARPKHG